MDRKHKIATEKEYNATMREIDALMKKGENNLTAAETKKLGVMAQAAELFEDEFYPLPMPKTIPEMVELKMFQMKLTQAALADIMGLGRPKLSQILSGKREPDVTFLKAAFEKLHIDPAFLLKNV